MQFDRFNEAFSLLIEQFVACQVEDFLSRLAFSYFLLFTKSNGFGCILVTASLSVARLAQSIRTVSNADTHLARSPTKATTARRSELIVSSLQAPRLCHCVDIPARRGRLRGAVLQPRHSR